jgi:hypothetical protein
MTAVGDSKTREILVPTATHIRSLHAWIKVGTNQPAIGSDQNHRKAWAKKSKHSDALVIQAAAKKCEPAAKNYRTEQKRRLACDNQWQVHARDRKYNRRSKQPDCTDYE